MKFIIKLRTYKEIKDVINQGEKFILKSFIIYRKKLPKAASKLVIGILLSKKFGKAVDRNYARRRIVALLNQSRDIAPKTHAYTFIPRQSLIKKDYSIILSEIRQFFREIT